MVWKSLRTLRMARAAGDLSLVEEARFDLDMYAQITSSVAIRERCTLALIADDNLPAVVAAQA